MLSITATMSLALPSAVSRSPVAAVGAATVVQVDSVAGASVYSKAIPPLAIVTSGRAFVKNWFVRIQEWRQNATAKFYGFNIPPEPAQ